MSHEHVITQSSVWETLIRGRHVGPASGLTCERLAAAITGRIAAGDRRRLRHCVEALRRRGYPLCAHPLYGYYVAACAEDVDVTCIYLYERAMRSLTQICALKRLSVPDLRGQLRLPTDETEHTDDNL